MRKEAALQNLHCFLAPQMVYRKLMMTSRNLFLAVLLVHLFQAGCVSEQRSEEVSSTGPGLPGRAEVVHLPGFDGELPSKHSAGYITVDERKGRHLYYYLVTAEGNPSPSRAASPADAAGAAAGSRATEGAAPAPPLVLWLTGGPGCSSMDAFTYENGPFTFQFKPGSGAGSHRLGDVTLSRNLHSWSQAAHMLYVDSPAGTGMSYTEGARSYTSDDKATITDLYAFLSQWFELYPEFKGHPLYLAGESYAGVYIPLLAQKILHEQKQASVQQRSSSSPAGPSSSTAVGSTYRRLSQSLPPSGFRPQPPEGPTSALHMNLVGYIVGNGVTDDTYDSKGQVEFAWGMGLVDPTTYNRLRADCQGQYWNVSKGTACGDALLALDRKMGNVNPYDILSPCVFHHDGLEVSQQEQERGVRVWPKAPVFPPGQPVTNWWQQQRRAVAKLEVAKGSSKSTRRGYGGANRQAGGGMLGHTIPCADRSHALLYYNTPEVRTAIHAAPLDVSGRWEPCSDVLHYRDTPESLIPVHRELLEAGLKALILSGDHDYVVPYTGTRDWVWSMQMEEEPGWEWGAWHLADAQQVAGYSARFKSGLTFATVKGAGHMVPQTAPEASLRMLQLWLAKEL